MKPVTELPTTPLDGVLFDLDDTVLSHGILGRAAYEAIWNLHESGMRLVAVTGRPSGWGEVIARQWPIDGAVTENGAVHVVREGKGIAVRFDGTEDEVATRRARLAALVAEVAEKLPEAKLADDNHARRSDVAWDIAEREKLSPESIAKLFAIAHAAGARTTRSSVHLHATFEKDDKASGVVRFLRERWGVDAGAALHRYAFVGDSGNDGACFSAFRHTFGVANVRRYIGQLSVPPRWIASREMGDGFAQIAEVIMSRRHGI